MRKLRGLRLVDEDGEGRLAAVPLDEAKRRMDQTWDDLFAYSSSREAKNSKSPAACHPAGWC